MPTTDKGSKLTELIRLLNQATDRGSLPWEATPDEDEFRAILSNGLVKILKTTSNYQVYAPTIGPSPDEKYSMQILDSANRVIDLLVPSGSEEAEQLKELFWKARRSALRVDQLYGALLNELKSRAGQ